jgi:hypothetical protein
VVLATAAASGADRTRPVDVAPALRTRGPLSSCASDPAAPRIRRRRARRLEPVPPHRRPSGPSETVGDDGRAAVYTGSGRKPAVTVASAPNPGAANVLSSGPVHPMSNALHATRRLLPGGDQEAADRVVRDLHLEPLLDEGVDVANSQGPLRLPKHGQDRRLDRPPPQPRSRRSPKSRSRIRGCVLRRPESAPRLAAQKPKHHLQGRRRV